jgi:segregation and condensation protein B
VTEIPGKKNDGHAGGGLAEEAAAWVPPWAREPESPVSQQPLDEPVDDDADLDVVDAEPVVVLDVLDDAPAFAAKVQLDSPAAADVSEDVADLPQLADAAAPETADLPRPRISTETVAQPEFTVDTKPETDLLAAAEARFSSAAEPEPHGDEPSPDAEPSLPADVEVLAESESFAGAEPELLPEPEAEAEAAQHSSTPELTMPGIADDELIPALEAIMLVVDEPVSEILLAQVLEVPAEQIAGALIDLSAAYSRENRGFDLRRAAGGWRFYTRAEYAPYVERFVLDGQQLRLTQASLETLAVVAYKQPVTRSRISAIRGVNCDGVIRTLVTRGMIEECGTEPESGAYLYRTTTLFLEKLGLDSVEQLPSLAPFLPENVEEIADEQR